MENIKKCCGNCKELGGCQETGTEEEAVRGLNEDMSDCGTGKGNRKYIPKGGDSECKKIKMQLQDKN